MFSKNSFYNTELQNNPWLNKPPLNNNSQTLNINQYNQQQQQNEIKFNQLEQRINCIEKELVQIKESNNMDITKNINVHNVSCSNCKKNQIIGYRYLCGNCNQANVQFNLCNECIQHREKLHYDNHFFIMIHNSNLWSN